MTTPTKPTKPSEKPLKPNNPFETTRTGTLIRLMSTGGSPLDIQLIEEELNARFTKMDRDYWDAISSSREADKRERGT